MPARRARFESAQARIRRQLPLKFIDSDHPRRPFVRGPVEIKIVGVPVVALSVVEIKIVGVPVVVGSVVGC